MKGYTKYLFKKMGWYMLTLFVAMLLNFTLPRLMPGNPVSSIISAATEGLTDYQAIREVYEAFMAEFGLDKPIWQQFFIYVSNLLQGNLGFSFIQYPRPVAEIIRGAVPWTLRLQLPAIFAGWLLGNTLGALAAYRRGVFDRLFFPFFLFVAAIPAFGLAIVNVHFLANQLRLFPQSLGFAFDMLLNWRNPQFILSMLRHYQLPFITLVIAMIGGQSLGMREMSLYELNADYVKYSRLMGIKDNKIVFYVFRNAMLPQITGLALFLGTMIGGNLVAEIVFSYPGIGTTLFRSIISMDFPVISACTLMITILVLAANFIIDVICGIIDPRVRLAQQEEVG